MRNATSASPSRAHSSAVAHIDSALQRACEKGCVDARGAEGSGGWVGAWWVGGRVGGGHVCVVVVVANTMTTRSYVVVVGNTMKMFSEKQSKNMRGPRGMGQNNAGSITITLSKLDGQTLSVLLSKVL